jgi:hypothetical protein
VQNPKTLFLNQISIFAPQLPASLSFTTMSSDTKRYALRGVSIKEDVHNAIKIDKGYFLKLQNSLII